MSNNKKIESLYGNFELVGTPIISDKEDKFHSVGTSASGFKYHRLQFGVKTSNTNVLYLEMMGGFNTTKANVIKTRDKDGNEMEIAWADRFDASIASRVPDYAKFRMNLVDNEYKNSKMFLTEFDAIDYVKANLSKDMRVVVGGKITINKYTDDNGNVKINKKLNPTRIRLAKADELDKAEATISFVFDKDSMDCGRFETEGAIDIDAYMTVYNKAVRENEFVPMRFILDVNYLVSLPEIPVTEANREMASELYKKYLTAEPDQYIETQWLCHLVRGAVEEEITMNDLSEEEKAQLAVGMVTFEQIKKQRRGKLGAKVDEIRLIRPTNNFGEEGKKTVNKVTNYTEEDFYAKSPQIEKKEEVLQTGAGSAVDDEKLLMGLFGQ